MCIRDSNGTVICSARQWEDGTQDDRWYNWRLQNWDTKWEAYDKEISHVDEDTFQVTFNTAWSPPEGIYARIRERFSDLYVTWFIDEPGMEIAGYF